MEIKSIDKLPTVLLEGVVYIYLKGHTMCMEIRFNQSLYSDSIDLRGVSSNDAIKRLARKGMGTLYLLGKFGEKGYDDYIESFFRRYNHNLSEEDRGWFTLVKVPKNLEYPIFLVRNLQDHE